MTLWCQRCQRCQILHYEQKIKRHVRSVKGVKHCTVIPIKDQKAMYVGGVEGGVCGFYTALYTK